MAPFAGAGACEPHAGAQFAAGLVQAFHQVVRQERAIARYAEQPLDAVVLCRQPVEPGENPGERTHEAPLPLSSSPLPVKPLDHVPLTRVPLKWFVDESCTTVP